MSLYEKELMWAKLCDELKKTPEVDETDETDETRKTDNKKILCEKIKNLKLDYNLFLDLPGEFVTILLYVRNLRFEEVPNYKYIINALQNLLDNLAITNKLTI
jgi:hypothetical protein